MTSCHGIISVRAQLPILATGSRKILHRCPIEDEVLYQTKSARPVLIFKKLDDLPALPDIHITLEMANGLMCGWFPEVDENGIPGIPGAPDIPQLMDFGIWGTCDWAGCLPRTGSLRETSSGIRPRHGNWPVPIEPVNTGIWRLVG